MSAKLLSSLADESSDLQRQIGCMTGIFQIFDGQHLLSGKRSNLHHLKRQYSGSIPTKHYVCSPPVGQEKSSSLSENQRASMESSGNSSSSSSCSSSFSSLEHNKSTQQEPSTNETATYAKISSKDPSKSQLLLDGKACPIEPSCVTSKATAKGGRQSTDFRDIVKDSIHREAQGLVRIPASEVPREKHHIELKDSPRSQLLYKSDDYSYLSMTSRKIPVALDHTESMKITSKLREKYHPSSEIKEHSRSSSAFPNNNQLFPFLNDVPQMSHGERDIPRVSLDSRESGSSTSRLRELSRLSLDGRESSRHNSEAVFNAGHTLKDTDSSTSQQKVSKATVFNKMGRKERQPPSVVAKLMGLETMPNKIFHSPKQIGIRNSNLYEGVDVWEAQNVGDCSFNSSKAGSPKNSIKVNVIPQRMVSHLKVPIEAAPWSQKAKGHRASPNRMPGRSETRRKQQHESVYGEIQKKLKDLEFQPGNQDLRALKQILDAIHAKGLLEVKIEEEEHLELATKNICGQQTSFDLACPLARGEGKCIIPSRTTDACSMKTWESPIVIMKPAKSLNGGEGFDSSIDSLVGVTELRTTDAADSQNISSIDETEKEQIRNSLHSGKGGHVQATEKKSVGRINARFSQKVGSRTTNVLSRQEKKSSASGAGPTVSCNSSSPRLRQKKRGMENKSCHSPSSDSSKQQKPLGQSLESVSPRNKLKPNLRHEKKASDDSGRGRNSRSQGIQVSQRLKSNGCYTSQVEMEPTSSNHSAEQESASSHDNHEATGKVDNLSTSIVRKQNDYQTRDRCSSSDAVATTSDQPSPVSVLDASLCKDEVSGSRVRSVLFPLKGAGNQNPEDIAGDRRWNLQEKGPQTNTIVRKKLKSIENLVKKLEQLGSSDNQDSEANHISFLWETQKPDLHYVSEILLASGLMLNDLNTASPQIKLHQSGYPINPNLFLVLEQKRSGSLAMLQPSCQNASVSKVDPERVGRRLTFDMVNEILAWKLHGDDLPPSYPSTGNLSRRVPNGQLLLKEICAEIKCLENDGAPCSCISSRWDEEGWTSPGREVSGLVLKIERLIFKDLIGELVTWEPMMAQRRLYPRRRMLFA